MFKNFKRKRIIRGVNINAETVIINKTNNITKILLVLLILIIWTSFYIKTSYDNFKDRSLIQKEIIIAVKHWYNINDLSNELKLNKNFLKIYLKKNNPDFKLIAWNFKISKWANIEQILIDLQKPIIENEINITILEWWNVYDIDHFLTKKWLIEKYDYIKYITNSEKIKQLTKFFPFLKWLNTLEWYLYPDTYTVISNNFKINVFVIKQLDNFEQKVYNKILSKHDNETIQDVLKLASIVEKEEKNIAEKSTVAWILKKRLNNWWMIWADITVCYPHKLTANECKMVITKYINEKSEYNTRTMSGLPKTPIWNPSFETINATLYSKNTSHWFYLHDTKTWKIYYADSNEWHTINKNRYLR